MNKDRKKELDTLLNTNLEEEKDALKDSSGTNNASATMGQMFPNQGLQQTDLRQMRQPPR